MRREFPSSVRVVAFTRAGGRCEMCTSRLSPGNVHYDHRIADGLGGEPVLENCSVLCRSCHGAKTFVGDGLQAGDVTRIAKAKRVAAKNIGAREKRGPALMGTKRTGWKHKISGEWVRR